MNEQKTVMDHIDTALIELQDAKLKLTQDILKEANKYGAQIVRNKLLGHLIQQDKGTPEFDRVHSAIDVLYEVMPEVNPKNTGEI